MTGIVLNGDGTATLTIDAADVARLPLGHVGLGLTVWVTGAGSTLVRGTLAVLDSSLAGTTTSVVLSASGVQVSLSETSVISGSQFVTDLTFAEAATDTPIIPSAVDWRLTYSPQGSSSAIEIALPIDVIVGGVVTYTVSSDVPTVPWPTCPIVNLVDFLTDAVIATTSTDVDGHYIFRNKAAKGRQVLVDVPSQACPVSPPNQLGHSGNRTLTLGVNALNVVCSNPV